MKKVKAIRSLKLKIRIKFLFILTVLSAFFAQLSHANEFINHQRIQLGPEIDADIIQIQNLSNLKLFLYDQARQPLLRFENIKKSLNSCETLEFAMNAGMYHPDYAPVGLYIENQKEWTTLNEQKAAYGNFFMQPNGVLAWNKQQAIIATTSDFKNSNFKANYATQSGPMLVINGNLNPKFNANSESLKVRNGVGLKDNALYFVITRNRVNLYQFADFFKNKLHINNALYLDGSISSLYFPKINRQDHHNNLGPMLAFINSQNCS